MNEIAEKVLQRIGNTRKEPPMKVASIMVPADTGSIEHTRQRFGRFSPGF
jgi:hypothetical protein